MLILILLNYYSSMVNVNDNYPILEKVYNKTTKMDDISIVSFDKNYYLNFQYIYPVGKYMFRVNNKTFYRLKINRLFYLLFYSKVISIYLLKKMIIYEYYIKLLLLDIYRVYSKRLSIFYISKIVKNKLSNNNLMFLMKEFYNKKYDYYYWEINVILKRKRENITYCGIVFLSINSMTGEIVSEY